MSALGVFAYDYHIRVTYVLNMIWYMIIICVSHMCCIKILIYQHLGHIEIGSSNRYMILTGDSS